jgi:hypothetical protein
MLARRALPPTLMNDPIVVVVVDLLDNNGRIIFIIIIIIIITIIINNQQHSKPKSRRKKNAPNHNHRPNSTLLPFPNSVHNNSRQSDPIRVLRRYFSDTATHYEDANKKKNQKSIITRFSLQHHQQCVYHRAPRYVPLPLPHSNVSGFLSSVHTQTNKNPPKKKHNNF